jgi:hypothetical protein
MKKRPAKKPADRPRTFEEVKAANLTDPIRGSHRAPGQRRTFRRRNGEQR